MKLGISLDKDTILFSIDGTEYDVSTCVGDDFILDLKKGLRSLKANKDAIIKGWMEGVNLVLECTAKKGIVAIKGYIEDDTSLELISFIDSWVMNIKDFEAECKYVFNYCSSNRKKYEELTGLKLPIKIRKK